MRTNAQILLLLAFFVLNNAYAQINYADFSETFDSNSTPIGWENEIESGSTNWKFENGSIDNTHPPLNSYEGDYNAVFLFANNSNSKTKLVTPEINFFNAIKPVLQFQLAQYFYDDDFGSGNTRLSIYFRSPEYDNNNWTLVKTFEAPVDGWMQQEVLLPDTLAENNSVQIGFEGWSSKIFEHGTCIDDIKIIETGIIPKYISSITSFQPSTDVVPTGSENNPILRLKLAVKGNDGFLNLDSLVVNSLFDSEFVTGENDIKLFSTFSDRFNDTIQIGNASTFINGKAIFKNIEFDLPIGNSYLWVTYDVPKDESHAFKGKKLDASISINSIKINNELYPSSEMNPGGNDGFRLVDESLFFDNFEGKKLWNLLGEFEIDTVQGLGGFRPEPDPSYAQSGKNILGTDINGLGSFEGDYERNLGSKAYIAEADTVLFAKYYKDLKLGYYQWLNLYVKDSASIEISTNNGQSWTPIWNNSGAHIESIWSFKEIDLSSIADRQTDVKFRYTLGPTDISPYSGWNIDNFSITGTFVNEDAGFLSLISPEEGCGHNNPEPIRVTVKNYGYSATNDTIPIGFSIDDGDTWIMDTIFQVIERDQSVDFEFSELIDISTPGYHNIQVKTFYIGDEDNRNDLMDTSIFSSPNYTLPYAENFENNDGFWRNRTKNEVWEYGNPEGEAISSAASGNKCWVTSLSDDYENNSVGYLESPCFDFSSVVKPIFECKIWAEGEKGKDGLALFYSLDQGNSWSNVPTDTDYSFDWNWYNNSSISALSTEGWDSVENGWFLTRQILPEELAGKELVKFRFEFASDDTITNEGFAVDDVRIYEAPVDAGIDSIISPFDACYLSKTQKIKVAIKNNGIRKILPKDSLITYIVLNETEKLVDTFFVESPLEINDTVQFTFSNTLNLFDKASYKLTAYTCISGDTLFYTTNSNDSISDTISVYGEPYYSLGPDIGTTTPDTVELDAGAGFANYSWKDLYNLTTGSLQHFDVPSFPGGVKSIDFAIEIENDSGCYAFDTIRVINSIANIGVTSISGIENKCFNKQNEFTLDVVVENFATDTVYKIGDTLNIAYSFDNENIHTETITLSSTLAKNETVNYSFLTPPSFPDSGNFVLKVFSIVYADLDYSNDTQSINLNIYPLPNVEIGNDTIYTLDAISEIATFDATNDYFGSYKWQDNSINPTFTLTTNKTASYFVEVADTNNCGISQDTVVIISDNWLLDSIISPQNSCILTSNEQVSIHIKNESPNNYPVGYKIPAKLEFEDSVYIDTIILSEEILTNESFDYTFLPSFNLSKNGEYGINIQIKPFFDNNLSDNIKDEIVEIWGIFPVNIGPDTIITKKADTLLFNAGDYYESYLWQDGSDNQKYAVPYKNSYQYSVTVTDEHNCSNSSDLVQIMAYDIGVTEIITPESNCNLKTTEKIKLSIFNYGPDILPAGENISFFYQIDEGSWNEINHTMSVDVESGRSSTIVLFETIPFNSENTYTMKLYSRWDKDYFYSNDTISKVIYQYDSPTVDLGEDIYSTQPDTIIIDGGIGQTTYTWQDGSSERFFNVTQKTSEEYSILVTNSFGCQDRDSIHIYTFDLSVDSILPLKTCNNSLSTHLNIHIKNNGQDTLKAGNQITALYIFDGSEISEEITLTSQWLPENILDYTFDATLTIVETGDYSISSSVAIDNEVNSDNNSKSLNFRVGTIKVDLGKNISTYDESVILDAGAQFENYIWNTDETSQTIEVSNSGKYKVTVTDVNQCSSSDSINVIFINPNYEITEILGLKDDCLNSNLQTLSFTLENQGNDTIFADSIIAIEYTINGGSTISESYTFTSNFYPENQVEIVFDTKVDLSEPKTYDIWTTAYFGESPSQLDTTINTWGNPDINLGDDINTYADSTLLDAGAGFESYLWNTEEITQIIEVRNSGKYKVTVTSSHQCSSIDSINVLFLNPLYEITEIIGLKDDCTHSVAQSITFTLENKGNDTIFADSIINIEYLVNNENLVEETFTVTNKFIPGNQIDITFETTADISKSASYLIKTIAYFGSQSSKLDTLITTWGLPEISLGPDIQTEEDEVTLDAGEGFESYLWSTEEETQEITVEENGIYWVEVSNVKGCINSDTISVYFVPLALQVKDFITPKIGCGELNDASVQIKIINNGEQTIETGTELILGYQLKNEDRINESVSFASNVNPNDERFYTFNTTLSLAESGTYQIDFFIEYEDEDLDTANYQITIYEKPIFFDGKDSIKVEGYPYILNSGVTAETYLWNTNEETESITVNEDNWYSVTITQINTCQFTDSVFVLKPLGISNTFENELNIYPNPASDKVIIETGNISKNTIIEISNVNGKVVYRKNKLPNRITLNTSNWNNGIYIIHLFNETDNAIYQLIKQ